MARDRDTDSSGTSQSKRASLNRLSSDLQLYQVGDAPQSQHHSHHHRPKSQKHVVGGGTGGRLHARVPSSKALHKHHATSSTTKLTRRASSPSPERRPTPAHRRSTSDVKLSRDPSSSNLKKNSSHGHLPRNRSTPSIVKKAKPQPNPTEAPRSSPNAAQSKRPNAASKVHFDIGDDEPGDDGEPEDEWVDASNSASPHLSRRSSVAQSHSLPSNLTKTETVEPEDEPEQTSADEPGPLPETTAHSLTRRILQRVPSQGTVVPPTMFTENVSARPPSSRQESPDSERDAPSAVAVRRVNGDGRPGSSGREQLTSRFVGNGSQITGSGAAGDSFLNKARPARPATNGKTESNGNPPRRPRSMVDLGQAQNDHARGPREAPAPASRDSDLTDEEDGGGLVSGGSRRTGFPRELNRTQQKLNLQRASSTLETAPPHPIGLGGVPVSASSMLNGGYGSGDPRLGKAMERTGMEYLVVRRYQNPVARSLARLNQLPGANKNRQIPRPGTGHSRTDSGQFGRPASINEDPRDPHMAAMMNAQGTHTPRHARSAVRLNGSTAGFEADGLHDSHRLSGSSLVDGEEDAGTVALLRNMWDKNMDLSASQD
ncbi:hypothetical protein GQ53DRAFT_382330 [Thozetella sp. PMI_491]|nr:hypothetical protein GQ53DRAFT_382330 [Thozetella sp. PMI_491]